jgi:three-Cys-motif partner protein
MTSVVPDGYDGREQAFIKHELLKVYLQKLFLILGMSARRGGRIELCYVDCFAGPWGDESEGMDTTSIAISLRTLDLCRQTLGIRGISATIRAFYLEKDWKAFSRLSAYVASSTPKGIDAQAHHGNFVSLRTAILQWAGTNAFVFFFIDPMGWKEIGIETLRPLLERPRSEFLVNFMYDFINRTMAMTEWQQDMKELVGGSVHLDGLGPLQREQLILKTYRTNVKRCLPTDRSGYPPRSGYVRILDRTRDRPKYHLVYVTTHPRGIIEFMEISESIDLVQKRVRVASKVSERDEAAGMDDLFGAGSQVDLKAGHASAGDVDLFWQKYLNGGPRRIGRNEFADILEETDWFPGDLQSSLVRLVSAGRVRNLDSIGRRPKKPLHFDTNSGERLELVERGT